MPCKAKIQPNKPFTLGMQLAPASHRVLQGIIYQIITKISANARVQRASARYLTWRTGHEFALGLGGLHETECLQRADVLALPPIDRKGHYYFSQAPGVRKTLTYYELLGIT